MTADGFVARPDGGLDWMWIGQPDEMIMQRVIELADTCDTILLGRKMTPEFVTHWENIFDNQPGSAEHPLAQRMVNMRKLVFSRTQKSIKGRNAEIENGDLIDTVNALKQKSGKDIMVYGGASFAASLISQNLVDEFYIFLRPVAIGEGLSIFKGQQVLQFENTEIFKNGTLLNKYLPAK